MRVCVVSVSYTHLDVYKRQFCARAAIDALADLLSGDVIDAPSTYPLPIPMVDNVPESAHLYLSLIHI